MMAVPLLPALDHSTRAAQVGVGVRGIHSGENEQLQVGCGTGPSQNSRRLAFLEAFDAIPGCRHLDSQVVSFLRLYDCVCHLPWAPEAYLVALCIVLIFAPWMG